VLEDICGANFDYDNLGFAKLRETLEGHVTADDDLAALLADVASVSESDPFISFQERERERRIAEIAMRATELLDTANYKTAMAVLKSAKEKFPDSKKFDQMLDSVRSQV
jgi:hypothetical protein